MLKKLSEGAIGNICKLAVCGAVAVTCSPATAVAIGLSLEAKDIAASLFALGGAGVKIALDWPKSKSEKRPLWETLAKHLPNEARFDLGSDEGTSEAVAAFFEDALLDLSLPVSEFAKYREYLADADGVYTGISAAILPKLPSWESLSEAQQKLASKLLTSAVKLAVEQAKAQSDLIIVILEKAMADNRAAHDKTHAGLDEIKALLSETLLQKAKEENVSEAAVRTVLERALVQGQGAGSIIDWLPEWIERAARVFRTGENDDLTFQKAMAKADRLFESKQSNASQPIMDDLARLEAEEFEIKDEFKRRKIARIEKAIEIDQLELNFTDIPEKLFHWAKLEGRETLDDQIKFVWAKADHYGQSGQSQISPAGIITARVIYENLCKQYASYLAPLQYAGIRNNLGNVLRYLGTRLDGEAAIASLAAAEASYRIVLNFITRKNFPLQWAMTQNNLGIVLRHLGRSRDGEAGLSILMASEKAFRAALEVWTRKGSPSQWAMTQSNLGNVLCDLGERLDGKAGLEYLKSSEAAYYAALNVYNRKDFPNDWALVHINLGTVQCVLGKLQADKEAIENFKAAEASYRTALQVRTRKDFPIDWAGTQCNLGNVFKDLGVRLVGSEGLEYFEASDRAYRAALEVRTRKDFPYEWAQTQENVAILYGELFKRTADVAWFVKGLEAVEGALDIYQSMKSDFFINKATRLRDQLNAKLDEAIDTAPS